MSTGAIVQTSSYNGVITDGEALSCALALSMDSGNVACNVKYGHEMKLSRLQRFEQQSCLSKKRVSTQSGRLAVESQKASVSMFDGNVPSRPNISMSNSCLFQAVGKVMDLDPKTLKYIAYQRLKKTDHFDWGGFDIEAFASGRDQSNQIAIKALADALGIRIAVKGLGDFIGCEGDIVTINFSGSFIGDGGHFYADSEELTFVVIHKYWVIQNQLFLFYLKKVIFFNRYRSL
jgi:hypothetical protein